MDGVVGGSSALPCWVSEQVGCVGPMDLLLLHLQEGSSDHHPASSLSHGAESAGRFVLIHELEQMSAKE